MDAIDFGQGADWTAVAALIQARQRDVANRVAVEAALDQPTGAKRERTNQVLPLERAGDARTSTSGEAGLGTGAFEGQTGRLDQTGTQTDARGLTQVEQDMVADLKARDAEVRRHEQAHAAVGGQYAGSPTYTYQTGPDGQQYAIGGAVSIDVSPVDGDPDATITKMEVVKAAALAPAEPSSADRQVAAMADAQRAQAVADLAALRSAEREGAVDRRI